jgi:hydrogenase maturation factor/phosphoheptose isomerase
MTATGRPDSAASDAGELGALAGDLSATALALARSFASGATMWCVAPAWPAHARHVAVEFVHPVIVGKRALPAVTVDAPDPVAALRATARTGDVLLAVSGASEPAVVDLMRRARAWGLRTIWIGAGSRPQLGAADHVAWVDDPGPLVPYSGRLVLLYHLLWELTHVCFEYPGLLRESEPDCTADVCITCSDEGVIGEVVAPSEAGQARVRTAGGHEAVDVTLIGAVAPGDLLLVHAGTALTRVGDGL